VLAASLDEVLGRPPAVRRRRVALRIPTLHARIADEVFIHGPAAPRMGKRRFALADVPTVPLVDGSSALARHLTTR
jgi:hypothetical protein